MEKFNELCKKIGFNNEVSAKLEILKVKTATNTWEYIFLFDKVIDPEITSNFVDLLKSYSTENVKNLKKCKVEIKYVDNFIEDTLVEKYYKFSLKILSKNFARLNTLETYNTNYSDNSLTINCPYDDKELVENLSEYIASFFEKLGVEITIDFNEIEGISQVEKIDIEHKEIIKTNIEQNAKPKLLQTGTVKGEKIKIKDFPFTSDEVQIFGQTRVEITGKLSFVEYREFKRGTSVVTAIITDDTNSIIVKKFFSSNSTNKNLFLKIIEEDAYVRLSGIVKYGEFEREVLVEIEEVEQIEAVNKDEVFYEKERIELNLHSKMTTLDAVTDIEDYVKETKRRGATSLALTDLNTVQAFPDFAKVAKASGIKPIYGVELTAINDCDAVITKNKLDSELDDITFTVFDIETTGLSVYANNIIEIAAVKQKAGVVIDKFSTFIRINHNLSEFTKKLTNIKDSDLVGAKSEKEVMTDFKSFIEGTVLVAHNASFDVDFIKEKFMEYHLFENDFISLDTLNLARVLYHDDPKIKLYNLKALSRFLGVEQSNHHRAIYDTEATAKILNKLLHELHKRGINNFNEVNSLITDENRHLYNMTNHLTVLAKNELGKKDMYKLLSLGNTEKFYKQTRVLHSDINKYRSNLLIGSSCVNGEIFEYALNKSYGELVERIDFYDYIEVQPPTVYENLTESSEGEIDKKRIIEVINRIIKAAKEKNKLIVATGDVHHLTKEQKDFRKIYLKTPLVGGGRHKLASLENISSCHYFTTSEMLEEFSFLNEEEAFEIVVTNTHKIADMIEEYSLFPKELFKISDDFLKDFGYPSCEEAVREMVYKNAKSIYSDTLPKIVEKRLDKEVNAILSQGFGNLYFISHLLVKNSVDAGFLVGSRGSVGSSLVATMMNITEVNPLPPHYVCPNCKASVFKGEPAQNEALESLQRVVDNVDSGYDLPDRTCPICSTKLQRDGNDTPFEVFLGFEGDKVPDIDLNFSGEYQQIAHEDLRTWFGKDYAFRAGTVSTIQDNKAFGFVKGYYKDKNERIRNADVKRIASELTGVRQSTGQHPGGVVVVPNHVEIYDVTPIQYPADDVNANWRTTHFDYHSFEDNLFKVDVLGHDDPTLIAYLMKHVKENPDDFPFNSVYDIPIVDEEVMKLFSSTESLGVEPNQILSPVGTYAIPEMGTQFVRQMLFETKPKTFSDLVKISGLSHGTDVWLNNAKDLVAGTTQYGVIDFSEVIGCRDDIMVYLMYQGVSPSDSFSIMETVRKGKKLSEEQIKIMKDNKVPEWYIWSCGQIKYMFPKAHAIAYVMMALRIAWFKVHAPIYFYSVYFSKRANYHDVFTYILGYNKIRDRISMISREIDEKTASATDQKLQQVLYVALEMTARNFVFLGVDLVHSDATEFVISEDKKGLYIPFVAIDGLGEAVANKIVEARKIQAFKSIKDFKDRSGCTKTILEKLTALGVFDGYDDSDEPSQMTLDLF